MPVSAARALDPHRPADHPAQGTSAGAADLQVLPRPPTGVPEVHQIRGRRRRGAGRSGGRADGRGRAPGAPGAPGRGGGALRPARRVGAAAPARRDRGVFIFVSARHVLRWSPPGWERRALGEARPCGVWGWGERERGKFGRAR